MKVLVYSHVPLWEQHHAETIEICEKHINQNHDVFILNCNKKLFNCPANIHKLPKVCDKCLKQTNRTLNYLFEYNLQTLLL